MCNINFWSHSYLIYFFYNWYLLQAEGEEDTVLVAGDPEKRHMETCDKRGGIPYHPSQIKYGASFYCVTYIPLHVELEIIGSY